MKLTGTEKIVLSIIISGLIVLSFTLPKAIDDIKNYVESKK
jgi:hypothetical protein